MARDVVFDFIPRNPRPPRQASAMLSCFPRVVVSALLVAVWCLPARAVAEDDAVGQSLQDAMIWAADAPVGRQAYVVFRKQIELPSAPRRALMHLFADSRYALWINGEYVAAGPCRFDPKWPEYDTLDVTSRLRQGANAIAIVVHHLHDGDASKPSDFSGRIMRHAPGVTARLEITDAAGKEHVTMTDATWRVGMQTRFLPTPLDEGPNRWSSLPDRIDARRDVGDWTRPDFDDAAWPAAIAVDGRLWGPLRSRAANGIPLLRETEVKPLALVDAASGQQRPLGDALPLRLKAGDQAVIAAGRFVQAYSVLELDAAADSVLEIEYPQTFRATGNKPSGGWGRVNRYFARAGRQTYQCGDTFGCTHLIVRCVSGEATLHGVKFVNRLYPFDVAGRFHCNEPLLDSIWQIGVNTILTCSEDAYVDCATRERVEWLADGLMIAYPVTRVALTGPAIGGRPAYGDARLLRNLLRHIGQSQLLDGRVKAHHPSDRFDIHGVIEDYCCLWIQGLRTYHEDTGDLELVREQWPAVGKQLHWFLDRRTERGLVKAREFVYFGNPTVYHVCEGATLNCYLYRALVDAAWLARLLGKPTEADEYIQAAETLRGSINKHLWDEAAGSYHGALEDGKKTPATAHAAAIALYFGVVPPERLLRARNFLVANHAKEQFFPYTYRFLLQAFFDMDTDAADRVALDLIRRGWAPMAAYETKTTWESFGPDECCHESGASPTYFLSAYVLGVRVDGPVSRRRLLIEPLPADLASAEGTVVTGFGPVPISWNRAADGKSFSLETTMSEGVTAAVALPRLTEKPVVTVDGQPTSAAISDRHARVELGPGKHVVRVRAGN
jgi:alpha-L-rhamnosidase